MKPLAIPFRCILGFGWLLHAVGGGASASFLDLRTLATGPQQVRLVPGQREFVELAMPAR